MTSGAGRRIALLGLLGLAACRPTPAPRAATAIRDRVPPPAPVVRFAIGEGACLVRDGRVLCWAGSGWGDGPEGPSAPAWVPDLQGAVEVGVGSDVACARLRDGTVPCWGAEIFGEFRAPSGTAVHMRSASNLTCTIRERGALVCWNQLALTERADGADLQPFEVEGVRNAVEVAIGDGGLCVRLASGRLLCWHSFHYEPGPDETFEDEMEPEDEGDDGEAEEMWTPEPGVPEPIPVDGLEGAAQIALGDSFGCARDTAGRVSCFDVRVEEDSEPPPAWIPHEVLTGASYIAAAGGHACAIVADAEVRCWGDNGYGQLGDGTTRDSETPVAVAGVGGAVELALTPGASCALGRDGTVTCWGSSLRWNPDTSARRRSPGFATAIEGLAASELLLDRSHHCARTIEGELRCWGDASREGGITEWARVGPPSDVERANDIRELGGRCHVWNDGVARCVGRDPYAREDETVELSGVRSARAGGAGLTWLSEDGVLRTRGWADEESRELGRDVHSFITSRYWVCAIGADGHGRCTHQDETPPEERLNLISEVDLEPRDLVDIAMTRSRTVCALDRDGHVHCARLGYSRNTIEHERQLELEGVREIVQVDGNHYGLLGDGSVVRWGDYAGVRPGREPSPVEGLAGVRSIATNFYRICALLESGAVRCRGRNRNGELGVVPEWVVTSPVRLELPE